MKGAQVVPVIPSYKMEFGGCMELARYVPMSPQLATQLVRAIYARMLQEAATESAEAPAADIANGGAGSGQSVIVFHGAAPKHHRPEDANG